MKPLVCTFSLQTSSFSSLYLLLPKCWKGCRESSGGQSAETRTSPPSVSKLASISFRGDVPRRHMCNKYINQGNRLIDLVLRGTKLAGVKYLLLGAWNEYANRESLFLQNFVHMSLIPVQAVFRQLCSYRCPGILPLSRCESLHQCTMIG